MAIKPPSKNGESLPTVTGWLPIDEVQRWKSLTEHLTLLRYDDGTTRKTSTLFLFVERGEVRLAFNDRNTGETAWVGAPGILEALDQLNLEIESGTLTWRAGKSKK